MPPGLTALDAVLTTVYFMEQSMQTLYPDDIFFATEAAAQAAAEATAEKLAFWQAEKQSAAAAVAAIAIASAGVAAIAAWKSPLGRKVRNKIVNAIKAE